MKNKRKINNILCKITVIVLLAASVILPYSINFTRAQAATEIVAAESSESTSSDIVKTRKGVIADWFYFPFVHIPLELHADSDCICMTVSDGTACLSDGTACLSDLNCIYF